MRYTSLTAALLFSTSAVAAPPDHSARPVAAATQAARVEPRPYGWQGASQLFSYAPGGLYQVYAAVGQVTDIMLQEGETLSDTGAVAAGDTVRWVIDEASSGTGPTRRTHILVKPTDPGLKTNLVINTDRRTYHVEIRSTSATYMASVGWSYPQDELIAVKARIEAAGQVAATQVQAGIDPARLDFSYRLSGDTPPWRPVQVFDDGAKTYLLFPASIAQSELPPLFLLGEKNKAELVNYRVSGHYIVVDRLFAVAELRLREAKVDEDMRRLVTIPGVGAITAATIKALVPDPGGFKSARHFAAWIGLTPRPRSSGGKERLGRISKMGNPDLRSLLVVGATSVLRYTEKNAKAMPWLTGIVARRPYKVAAVALAIKMARIVWAVLTRGGVYQRGDSLAAATVTA